MDKVSFLCTILTETEFNALGSKRQRDKLKSCFPIDILGRHIHPAESIKNFGMWFDSDFPCPNMFRMSAKVVL